MKNCRGLYFVSER